MYELVVPPPLGGADWLLPPHPVAPPINTTARRTSSSPPNRRLRRGTVNSNREATATPDPAYHGARLVSCLASVAPESNFPGAAGTFRSAVMPDSDSVVDWVPEGIVTVVGLKVSVGTYPLVVDVTTPEKVTVPVKPYMAAAAMVTEGIVPPAATVTDAFELETVNPVPLGVRLKSGQALLLTCTSTGLTTNVPLDS